MSQVVSLLEDTTYLKCKKSNDPSYQVLGLFQGKTILKLSFYQADFFSGRKGHGSCVQVGNITDASGYCPLITPGTIINFMDFSVIGFSLVSIRLSSKHSAKAW